jgi:succinate-acetate transporter protein
VRFAGLVISFLGVFVLAYYSISHDKSRTSHDIFVGYALFLAGVFSLAILAGLPLRSP